jgi:hypothetical protein
MEWLIVALFGGLVGASELVNRYRDAPVRAVVNWSAGFYILLNLAASLGALGLICAYDWKFGVTGDAIVRWTRVLVAGVGAMAFFRSSLFTVRAGDRDIAVGPAGFLQIFLTAADRGVDRLRAQTRASKVAALMKDVDYSKARRALPAFCLALMRNVPPEEQQALWRALALLDQFEVAPSVKSRLLGLELMNVVGEDVLKQAVNSLGAEIASPPGSSR